MEGLNKEFLDKKEDMLKNISDKINFLENKIQYLIDENADLKDKVRKQNEESKKLDLILSKLDDLNGVTFKHEIEELEDEFTKQCEKQYNEECEEILTLRSEPDGIEFKNDDKVLELEEESRLKEGIFYLDRYKNHEDLMIAIDALADASDLGSIEASALLGEIYHTNEIYKDTDLAIEYYKRAAFKGGTKSVKTLIEIYESLAEEGEDIYYHYLGDIYFNGEIVAKDRDKYMEYYTLAAEKDVEESIDKLIAIYKELARLNEKEASFKLGEIYYEGDWVEKDLEEAFDWFNKAESDGEEKARIKCGSIALEIAEALYEEENIKCIEWYNIASEKENREAQYKLGQLFEKGLLVEADEERALELYEKSASNGYFKAITKTKIIKPVTNLFNSNKE